MKLYVVGFGAGGYENMTIQAKDALENSDIIVGYTVYTGLLKPYFGHKQFYETPMMKEIDRCRWAIEKAEENNIVSMVCSGDSGVYGMASLIYELVGEKGDIDIEVISGVTAALSGGAVLGAPLTHDFAVISLSDLLTPKQLIYKRIECASIADFVICIYNPSSKKRSSYLQEACDIMLKYKSEETVCGFVKNIGRDGEKSTIVSLKELRNVNVDMFTTVFVGNSQTKVINGKMVTPRGYNSNKR
ncbi:precorrin-3B C(17)-methyltransferase [Sedimentibacter sp. zth1]|uniref:precorrin-3B C(17)-methyltransferase n=1 Tax=Sedimentibacter sp. zth1 TaxID=2816908 RepID=UPI001A92A1EB|nr:precorrin-3B C(17)-methyltransferase [Sedimentibacter sp. zth1]QSX05345.1 precorrin-3B C(17)-methyltransferase [Sedimentibacter sp. zth1]